MKKVYLDKNWTLKNEKFGKLDASVPGCVHTDLMRTGVIPDIFWRDNNKECGWIENCDWEYSCSFDAITQDNTTLVFEGLDTYTEIYLNGSLLGKTDNMFIPHRFDATKLLRSGENTLTVRFLSPIKAVADKPQPKGAFTRERMNTRRIQCTYGWDWVDRFVTCGIYRPVYLEYANGIDIEDVYVYTENIDSFGAQIYTEINFKGFEDAGVAHVEIIDPCGKVVTATEFYADMRTFVRRFDIAKPTLWYPNGYGEQPLYTLRVSVGENAFEQSFGIRTLKILQLTDEEGSEYYDKACAIKQSAVGAKFSRNEVTSGFEVIVNGERILCRGGNWVPCEPFPSAETDEKIEYLVNMAKDMGANFLRVWGGGLFEKSAFYDACDRCGILVAQDFLAACGNYPEKEEWYINALTKESEFAVKYLRNHPSLAWWHGDNENATHGNDVKSDYTGRDSALRGLAPQIYKYDRFRQFLPSSPYGGDTYGSLTAGTSHITNYIADIFNYFNDSDCTDYKEYLEQYTARFVSEDGTFGAPSRPSMLRFMTEDDLLRDPAEEIIFYHTKNNPALKRHILCDIISFTRKVLGEFADGEDKFFKYKYIQYEWVRVVFENLRRNLGYSNGLLFWMYNDCWPAAMGWTFVDYYGLPKASYYSFKRCAKHVVGSLKANSDSYTLSVSADTDINEEVTVTAYMLEAGDVIKAYTTIAQVSGYGCIRIDIPWTHQQDKLVVCDIEYSGGKDRCFYKSGVLELKPCDEDISVVSRTHDSITISSKKYAHAVELEGEYIFEDDYFSLLPSQTRTVHFRRVEGSTDDLSVKAYTVL